MGPQARHPLQDPGGDAALLESAWPLRALVMAFSSSTLKLPTGILEGVTGLRVASFSCLRVSSMKSQCFFSSSSWASLERASSSLFSVSSNSSRSQSFSSCIRKYFYDHQTPQESRYVHLDPPHLHLGE